MILNIVLTVGGLIVGGFIGYMVGYVRADIEALESSIDKKRLETARAKDKVLPTLTKEAEIKGMENSKSFII